MVFHGFDSVVVNHLFVRGADDAEKIGQQRVPVRDAAGDFEARTGEH